MIKTTVELKFTPDELVVVVKKMSEKTEQLVLDLASDTKETVFMLAPKRTGRLADSVQLVQTPDGVEVVVTAPYAAKVERDAGFFFRAVSEAEARLPDYLRMIEI
jgi:hypothetical protein